MMRFKTRTKVITVIAAGAIAIGTGSVAFAYWSSGGNGNGSVSTSNGASDLTITQTSVISDLAPGVAAETISGTVKNNAVNSAYVNTVTVSISSVVPVGSGTCDATDYTLTAATMSVGLDVASGATKPFSGAQLSFNDKLTNQDGCKGATVNLAYVSN